MSIEVDNISAVLNLRCPNHHNLGRLLTHRHQAMITHNGRPWTDRIVAGFFSFPVCPGGCQFEVVGLPEELEAKLRELANDPAKDEDTYMLRGFLGPPRQEGEHN